MRNGSKVIILLTACVCPNNMSFTTLVDSSKRKQQYVDALFFYLTKTLLPVVFVENSDTDFSNEFQEYIDAGRLEYLTYDGNNSFDRIKGKGYGEALMLMHAIEKSKMIKKSKYIIKISGRLIVENISFFNKSIWYVFPNVWRCNFESQKYAITTVFICRPQILYYILSCHKEEITEIDRGNHWIENIIYNAFKFDKRINPLFVPFGVNPRFHAYSGTSQSLYPIKPDIINLTDNLYELSILYKTKRNYFGSCLIKIVYYCALAFCRLV